MTPGLPLPTPNSTALRPLIADPLWIGNAEVVIQQDSDHCIDGRIFRQTMEEDSYED